MRKKGRRRRRRNSQKLTLLLLDIPTCENKNKTLLLLKFLLKERTPCWSFSLQIQEEKLNRYDLLGYAKYYDVVLWYQPEILQLGILEESCKWHKRWGRQCKTYTIGILSPPPKPQLISISNRSLHLGLRSFSAHRNWTSSSSIGKIFPPPTHPHTDQNTHLFFLQLPQETTSWLFFFSNWRKLWSLELWKNGTTQQLSSTVSESSISQLLQHTSRTLTNITHTKEESATKKQQFCSTSQHFQRRERERERERERDWRPNLKLFFYFRSQNRHLCIS